MGYNNRNILVDANGKPVPQLYNEEEDYYEVAKGKNGAANVNIQTIPGTIVEDYWEYNSQSPYTRTFEKEMVGISIANDGLENLTFTINGITRTVYAGEPYNATLKPFTQITINATDNYRAEVLS